MSDLQARAGTGKEVPKLNRYTIPKRGEGERLGQILGRSAEKEERGDRETDTLAFAPTSKKKKSRSRKGPRNDRKKQKREDK